MLERMSIKNYAVIDNLSLEFQSGLSAFTGETGTGKSVLIGALGLLLGARSDTSMIRTGEEKLIIEGEFSVAENSVHKFLAEQNIEDASSLIIRREITREGKNRVFINGMQETLGKLEDIGALLADMHGQHDHQLLLNKKVHIDILDRFAKLEPDTERVRSLYGAAVEALGEEKSLVDGAERLKKERDYYQNAFKQVSEAKFAEGEEAELEERLSRMQNNEKIFEALNRSYQSIYEGETNALALIEDARKAMGGIAGYAKKYEELQEIFAESAAQAKEGARLLGAYLDETGYSPEEMDECAGRIALLRELKRKYDKADIPALNAFAAECKSLLGKADNLDQELASAAQKRKDAVAALGKAALALSAKRQEAARQMKQSIEKELAFLAMEKAQFFANITYAKDDSSFLELDGKKLLVGPQGIDRVEFLLSANTGEEPKPLQKVASGGEISRVMLSLKAALAQSDPVATGIFDEIDAGIGGMVAHNAGQKMKEISKLRQLFTITHLAQIASKADHHYLVRKNTEAGKTFTEVVLLQGEERVKEVARMLGGEGEASLKLAREMMGRQG